ncbi:nuclear transport factor 2 family protein [Thalassotalea euphylliae]|uniref:nuclear transport factor 2 family protein n=1 Tax=Thalassotalea euphylliae TaxID=1655234 RepID=UPI00362FCFFE
MRFLVIVIVWFIAGCASTTTNSPSGSLSETAKAYFDVYAERKDLKKLMSFYDEKATLSDIIYGNQLNNKAEIKAFLAWDKGDFQLISGDNILTVTGQTISGRTVVTEGYFNAFSYDGQKLGPWLFVIVQEFNADNKIISQKDWINYTPRKHFLGGKNMNHLLLKNKVK